jgi:general secretion pathway protein E
MRSERCAVSWTLVMWGVLIAVPSPAHAQDAIPAPTGGPAPQAQAPAAGGGPSGMKFAPPAGGQFYRGNRSFSPGQNANNLTPIPVYVTESGFYVSLLRFLPVVFLFLFWTHTSNWVFEDSRDLKVRPVYWNSLQLAGGAAGLLLVNTIPMYLLGFFSLLGCYGAPAGLYVLERNQHVPENARVLTPDHIKRWTIRQLAKIGIHIGSREDIESAIGPPITLVGKTKTGRRDESRSR